MRYESANGRQKNSSDHRPEENISHGIYVQR